MLILAWSLTKVLFLNVLGKDYHHSEDVAASPSGSPGQAAVRLQQLLSLAWSLTKLFPPTATQYSAVQGRFKLLLY